MALAPMMAPIAVPTAFSVSTTASTLSHPQAGPTVPNSQAQVGSTSRPAHFSTS